MVCYEISVGGGEENEELEVGVRAALNLLGILHARARSEVTLEKLTLSPSSLAST
jgi:hypothetical protein